MPCLETKHYWSSLIFSKQASTGRMVFLFQNKHFHQIYTHLRLLLQEIQMGMLLFSLPVPGETEAHTEKLGFFCTTHATQEKPSNTAN